MVYLSTSVVVKGKQLIEEVEIKRSPLLLPLYMYKTWLETGTCPTVVCTDLCDVPPHWCNQWWSEGPICLGVKGKRHVEVAPITHAAISPCMGNIRAGSVWRSEQWNPIELGVCLTELIVVRKNVTCRLPASTGALDHTAWRHFPLQRKVCLRKQRQRAVVDVFTCERGKFDDFSSFRGVTMTSVQYL